MPGYKLREGDEAKALAMLRDGYRVAAVCRRFGVCRDWLWKLRKKHAAEAKKK